METSRRLARVVVEKGRTLNGATTGVPSREKHRQTVDPVQDFTQPSVARTPVKLGGPVLARVKHLNLTGQIIHRDAMASGHGGFSEVFRGLCRVQDLEEELEVTVAVKRLRYHLKGVDMEKVFEKEVYVWSKVNHPNVLRLMGFTFCEETGFPLLISRWMEKGSAWSYIMGNPHLTLAQRCQIVIDTAEGLRYLHDEERLVHGDIKADNVMIDHDGRALIGDFGCARFSEASLSVANQSSELKGTPRYWAPELASVSSVQVVYSEATDMWAFGMTVYEIIVRHRPFEGLNEIRTINAVCQGQSPPIPFEHKNDLGSEQSLFEDICRSCWSREPSHRPRAQFVLAEIAKKSSSFTETEQNLDALYRAVIEGAAEMSKTSRTIVPLILGFILASSKTEPLQPRVIHAFLPEMIEVPLSTVEKILKRMSPMFVDAGRGIAVRHTSVLDFCADKERCGEANYADPAEIEQIMATGCFEIMENGTRNCKRQENAPSGLHFNICKLESSYLEDSQVSDLKQRIAENISAELLYSCTNWFDHAMRAGLDGRGSRSRSSGLLSLSQAIKNFLCSIWSLFLFEVMNLCGRMDAARDALLRVHSLHLQMDAAEATLIREIAHEISLFIDQCLPAISISTPHLYLSLTWIASESKLWTYWQNEFFPAQILSRPLSYSPGLRLLSFDCPPKVDTFSMSPDGRYIASGSRDGYVRAWDLARGVVVHELKLTANHFGDASQTPPPIDALTYRRDCRSILCASGTSIVELDSETLLPKARATKIAYTGIWCIAVSNEPQHVAIGLEDGTIAILDAVTLSTVRHWEAHEGTVYAIAFDPYGLRLASASDDGTVCIWDAQSGECIKLLYTGWTTCSVAFSSDGKRVVSGDWSGEVQMVDAESGEPIGDRWHAGQSVLFLAFSPDESRIIMAVASKWNSIEAEEELPPASEARCYPICEGYLWAQQMSIQIWDANFLTRQTTSSPGHTYCVKSVAFSPDETRIVSGSYDWSVRVWDAETGEPVESAEVQHRFAVNFVAFSPDGNHIASGGDDGLIRVWDAQTGNSIRVLEGHTETVTCGAYSPDGTKIVSGVWDKTLRLWDASSSEQIGQPMTGHTYGINTVCFSPDGSYIASAFDDLTIQFWDGHTGEALGEPLTGHEGGVNCIAFSPDGMRIASGGWDSTVCLWDVEKRSCIGEPLKGHSATVTSVAFSPDSAFVFSGSLDYTIRCWDASSGEPVGHQLIGHTNDINCLAISGDGTRIATGSDDGTIRIWDSSTFHWKSDQSLAKCGLRGPDRIPSHIPDDGWIRTPNDGLLLWVPPEHRKVMCETNLVCISTDDKKKPIRVIWDKLCLGEVWTAVCGTLSL